MENKKGYSTITYKFVLNSQHNQWFYLTMEIYNLVLEFYYGVLQKEPELLTMQKNKLMRQLEILTVGVRGQEKEEIIYPLPYERIPLYFRRAAINDAIRLMRSFMTGKKAGVQPAKAFNSPPVFYKGMYKDFNETGICLKLWNGERWVWEKCGLDTCGRIMPKEENLLSPMLKLYGKKAMIHVPVVEEVEDVRTVKERLAKEERICAAFFPGNDCMAVLVVLNKNGEYADSLFIRGGNQLCHEKQKLLNCICKNRESMGLKQRGDRGQAYSLSGEDNRHLKEKIKNLTETYVHRVSRQIVDYLEKKHINILIVPKYTKSINLNEAGYLSFTSYDWLGRRIIQYIRYKAFAKGIAVSSVSTKNLAGSCYICGEPVKRFNKNNKPGRNYYGGKNYICPNGHKGNAYFNAAINTGRRFLKSQGEIHG